MQTAQSIIDEIYKTDLYDIEPNVPLNSSHESTEEDTLNEVSFESETAVLQELTVPLEQRDIMWAQTLIDTV